MNDENVNWNIILQRLPDGANPLSQSRSTRRKATVILPTTKQSGCETSSVLTDEIEETNPIEGNPID